MKFQEYLIWNKTFTNDRREGGGLGVQQTSQENACVRAPFLIKLQACNFIKKKKLAQVFSCEFCEIFKNSFFTELLWVTSSDNDD